MESSERTMIQGLAIIPMRSEDCIAPYCFGKVAFIAPREDSRVRVQRGAFHPPGISLGLLHAER